MYKEVMKIEMTAAEKADLESRHKKGRDRRVVDRIKAVLLHHEEWTMNQIAQALRIHLETVRTHLQDYEASQKLKPENGGSASKLDAAQTAELMAHLEHKTYMTARDICAHVLETYGISYTVQGMTSWLHVAGFSFKKPAATPAKADPVKQQAFVDYYEKLMTTTPEDEPIFFGDGVHPTMAMKVTEGWIRTGARKPIASTASRTRMNLMGALELEARMLKVMSVETLNSAAMGPFFEALRAQYPKARRIHLILDRGPYNVSLDTQKSAKKWGIQLHYLQPYSPNLNPIKRCWKIMNEHVRNNRFFGSDQEFRQAIMTFFDRTWQEIAPTLTDRVNDNFQRLIPVGSV